MTVLQSCPVRQRRSDSVEPPKRCVIRSLKFICGSFSLVLIYARQTSGDPGTVLYQAETPHPNLQDVLAMVQPGCCAVACLSETTAVWAALDYFSNERADTKATSLLGKANQPPFFTAENSVSSMAKMKFSDCGRSTIPLGAWSCVPDQR